MDTTIAAPVAATLGIVQAIKIIDKNDKLKAWYPAIALVIGALCGYLFGLAFGHTAIEAITDALTNMGASCLAWTAKSAVLRPAGMKLPGDSEK